jgi:hypothetical protein
LEAKNLKATVFFLHFSSSLFKTELKLKLFKKNDVLWFIKGVITEKQKTKRTASIYNNTITIKF